MMTIQSNHTPNDVNDDDSVIYQNHALNHKSSFNAVFSSHQKSAVMAMKTKVSTPTDFWLGGGGEEETEKCCVARCCIEHGGSTTKHLSYETNERHQERKTTSDAFWGFVLMPACMK